MSHARRTPCWAILLLVWCACSISNLRADETTDLKQELQELREQNRTLQNQLQQQQQMIDELSRKFSDLEKTNQQQQSDYRSLKDTVEGSTPPPPPAGKGFTIGNVAITGEGAAGIFETGKNGLYPNAAFRVSEARLFIDAPVWDDVYFYGQLDLTTPEAFDENFHLGELYLQFENLARHWDIDQLLNARLGQFYIPFGEEYLSRFAIDDPLISHSLSDIWGYDPGVELFGAWRKLSYVVAVQNGGISTLNDNTADKSVAARLGYDPKSWLHFSASAMRTGDLNANRDVSAVWFGNGLFESIGSPATSLFRLNLAELDADATWKTGHVKLAGGYAGYNDNDPAGDNHRDIYYSYLEALQHATSRLYSAARFSQIRARDGYPIYADSPNDPLTSDLWRLSLGLGYTFSSHLVLKVEYTMEHGEIATGGHRNHEDMLAAEAAFKF